MVTIAFDVYGTLIDTQGVVSELRALAGDRADVFAQTWREKQLEYTFRRGLMRRYENFAVCTRQALDYCCAHYELSFSPEQKNQLLEAYKTLPAFDDVEDGLTMLHGKGHRLFAFSNGTASAVDTLLVNAGIRDFFDSVISVDDLKTFKPTPDVYQHFLQQSGAEPSESWLISSNPFDVIGAANVGMLTAWLRRSEKAIFDPWGIEPTLTIESLSELFEKIDE